MLVALSGCYYPSNELYYIWILKSDWRKQGVASLPYFSFIEAAAQEDYRLRDPEKYWLQLSSCDLDKLINLHRSVSFNSRAVAKGAMCKSQDNLDKMLGKSFTQSIRENPDKKPA
ncbi:MAG TPA: hypothetical protein VH186_04510 [Chloroflexia bacterium]|nr:hypothetical protein [Chloroflexia bacterium]